MEAHIALGGEFVRVKGGWSLGRVRHERPNNVRGPVRGFSRQSRKRLFDFFAGLDRSGPGPTLLLTLTYPDVAYNEDWGIWKAHLQAFIRRFKRWYPGVAFVWRLEVKPRLSGEHIGEVMPHFHLLVFGLAAVNKEWLSRAWYEVVGSGDPKHLAAGTNCKRVKTWRGAVGYLAKDMAKIAISVIPTGRVWGVIARAALLIRMVEVALSPEQFYRLRRVLRAWLSKRLKVKRLKWGRGRCDGLTCYMPAADAVRLLAFVASI